MFSVYIPETKYMYLLISFLAFFYICFRFFLKRRLHRIHLIILFFLLICAPSVIYAQHSISWAQSQYISLIIRVLPAAFVIFIIGNIKPITDISNLVFITVLSFVIVDKTVLDLGNVDNVIAAILVSFFPFFMKNSNFYIMSILVLFILIFVNARMGVVAVISQMSLIYIILNNRRRNIVKDIVTLITIVCIIYWVSKGGFLEIGVIEQSGYDWVRSAMLHVTFQAIWENPIFGIGMGQISSLTVQIFNKEVLAHGFISYIWAQMGLIPFLFFIWLSINSVRSPANLFKMGASIDLVYLSASNLGSFLMFSTRTQQDNPIYFILLFLGISCIFTYNIGKGSR
jgi:hypothetical protein